MRRHLPPIRAALPAPALEEMRRSLAASLADPWFAERLFDCLPDVDLFVKDRLARYVVVSEGMVYRAGRRHKEELLGRTALDVFPPPLGKAYHDQDRRVLDTGTEMRDRLELHLFPEGSCWYLTHKFPLRDLEGQVVGLAGFSWDVNHPKTGDGPYGMVAEAVDYLKQNYAEPIRVEQLARMAHLSMARFERLIKRVFYVTPGQLLARTRLEAATRMLAEGDQSIAEVAHACGYTDHSAFCRQFKSAAEMTPREYRDTLRQTGVAERRRPRQGAAQ
ncbi:MAG TPA: AraC family transcriptional regulator [Thermoanaerobaculia bacterium]|jgi:AraC-like DNA-binding protein|nr:AraC family transcriptional regulator [Thermoanaerobaculia bacterium]